MLMQPGYLVAVPIVSVFLIMFGAPLYLILGGPLAWVLGMLLGLAFVTYIRTRQRRICTTTIAEAGIRDITPDTNKWLPWDQISRIELCEGDMYVFAGISRCIFVPLEAFPNLESAQLFFEHAQAIRKDFRSQNRILTEDKSHTALIEEREREEEAIWKALEDVGRKAKASESNKD